MSLATVVVSLPIRDRRASFDFYRAALDLKPVGEIADDGVPEPLQFELADDVRLMLIPTGGFGWVIGGHDVAEPGHSECLLTTGSATDRGVDQLVARAQAAGATIVTAPGPQPWGYSATFADPDGHLWMVRAEL
jgi:uncharacterized protein